MVQYQNGYAQPGMAGGMGGGMGGMGGGRMGGAHTLISAEAITRITRKSGLATEHEIKGKEEKKERRRFIIMQVPVPWATIKLALRQACPLNSTGDM